MDLPIGTWSYYYDNGVLLEEGSYHNGLKSGLWSSWDESGKKLEEVFHQPDGEFEWINFWGPNGKQLIASGLGNYKTFY